MNNKRRPKILVGSDEKLFSALSKILSRQNSQTDLASSAEEFI